MNMLQYGLFQKKMLILSMEIKIRPQCVINVAYKTLFLLFPIVRIHFKEITPMHELQFEETCLKTV